jgi:hypothetical protein
MEFAKVPATVLPASQEVWQNYLRTIDEARAMVMGSAWARTPVDRAQGLYYIQMLQTFGFNIYTAPRQAYPNFYTHSIFLPFELGFGAPAPDFFYHWTFLDGARTYRITGRRGTTRWAEMQAQRGFWGDADQRRLGNWDFDDFDIGPDGKFEIVASPTRQDGNWIELDPTARNITVIVRDAYYDWGKESGLELHIEAVGPAGDAPVAHSEEEMNRRLTAIGAMTTKAVKFFLDYNDRIAATVGLNAFYVTPMNSSDDVGGNPRASYLQMLYDIRPDEALIIETDIPDARYWSIQLADLWWQTSDYTYHHSSLNGYQTRIDADGKARLVLSAVDPGVPNWLDPVDNLTGLAQWRWYLTGGMPTPTVRKVPVADVRKHLPADTPIVTPDRRAAVIAARKRAVLGRFGF